MSFAVNESNNPPLENSNNGNQPNGNDLNKLILSTIGCFEGKQLPAITLEKGVIYVGEWKNGLRDGKGLQTWPEGSKYEGDWVEDKSNGKGKLTHANGDIYEGDWINDKANGEGTYIHANGGNYVGQWKNDQQNGNGVESWPDCAKYKGEYKEGKKNGKGKLFYADGSWYDGTFESNDIHGYGIYVWPDERRQEGEWYRNKMHGKGKTTWPDGRLYVGEYEDDKKHGFGTFEWQDGSKYVGEWRAGKKHGKGTYINQNGEERHGEWFEGERTKWLDEIGDAGHIKSLSYLNDSLCFDYIPLVSLAQKYGTPLYIYSQNSITNSYIMIKEAFSPIDSLTICYAVKSNSNLSILKLLGNLGSGFDIVSEGELLRVLAAGCDPHKIVFSGVGKSTKEIELALKTEILCFNVESESELIKINEIARSMDKVANISIRVNPDVDPLTHEYISTSFRFNKFGVSVPIALELYKKAKDMPGIKIKGIDCHLGSQIFSQGPYIEALTKIVELVDMLEKEGIKLDHLDMGGGFGVSYFEDEKELDIKKLAKDIKKLVAPRKLKLILEPGRFLVANAGILLTKVEYIKKTEFKNFAIIDAAMNDLIRPALYKAFHKIIEVRHKTHIIECLYDVVGPVCESGDFLGKERILKIEEGDFLAVLSSGAYGMTMSSNYNTRARAAEILLTGDQKDKIIKEKEEVNSIFENEKQFL